MQLSSRVQAQDEMIQDRILTLEKLLKEADERYLEQQPAHRSGMATPLDAIKEAREETREAPQKDSQHHRQSLLPKREKDPPRG